MATSSNMTTIANVPGRTSSTQTFVLECIWRGSFQSKNSTNYVESVELHFKDHITPLYFEVQKEFTFPYPGHYRGAIGDIHKPFFLMKGITQTLSGEVLFQRMEVDQNQIDNLSIFAVLRTSSFGCNKEKIELPKSTQQPKKLYALVINAKEFNALEAKIVEVSGKIL